MALKLVNPAYSSPGLGTGWRIFVVCTKYLRLGPLREATQRRLTEALYPCKEVK
jgi:hypothetical protein